MMLTTARQLSAGLGAPASKPHGRQSKPNPLVNHKAAPRKIGNASLGLWVGQRFLGESRVVPSWNKRLMRDAELYRRTGRDTRAKQQGAINEELSSALEEIEQRGRHAWEPRVVQMVP